MINLDHYDAACAGQAKLIWSIITRSVRDHNDRLDILHDSVLRFRKYYGDPAKRKVAASTAAYHCARNMVGVYYKKKNRERDYLENAKYQPVKYDYRKRSYTKDEQKVLDVCKSLRILTVSSLSKCLGMPEKKVLKAVLGIKEKHDDNVATKMATRITENHVS